MAVPTLATNAAADTLRITGGTEGDPVTWNDVWDWDDGGGSSGGDGDVPKDGGGTAKVNTFMTEHVADGMYQILKNVDFGDTSTATYFQSKNEMVYFEDAKVFNITNSAVLEIGDLTGDWGVSASMWRLKPTALWSIAASNQTGAILRTYNSILRLRSDITIDIYLIWTARNFTLNPEGGNQDKMFFHPTATISWKRCFVTDARGLYFYANPSDWENVHCHSFLAGLYFYESATLVNPYITGIGSYDILVIGATTGIVKDPLFRISKPYISAAGGILIEQYTCNIHVTDSDGNDLSGVTVLCEDKDGGEVFSVETDAEGDIAEQTINYKQWAGTEEALTEYSPHKFTFRHDDYPDYVMEDVTVDHPIVWRIEMGISTSDLETSVGNALTTYDPPTKTELDSAVSPLATSAALATHDSKLNTVDSNVDAILIDTGTTLDGKIDTIDSNVDAVVGKLPTNYVMGSSVQTAKDDEIDFIKNVLEGDAEIDTDATPWQLVVKIKGTDTELIRKDLKDASGDNVIEDSTIVGQQTEPA